jgi:2-polyprenyl-3-methyl-5-hydroxy-6-metoxy-1,4-benzoquinol methylase
MDHAIRQQAESHAQTAYQALGSLEQGYPANHFAFQAILPALADLSAHRVLEVGIGDGNAIPLLAGAGYDLVGMDIDPARVDRSRERIQQHGASADAVTWGDIEDATTYVTLQADAGFDALVALGVLPHVHREATTLRNMRALVRPGGQVFVECRNKLFSLITFNRYTYEFLMDDLFAESPEPLRDSLREFLGSRLDVSTPPAPSSGHAATFHNPLEVPSLFTAAGFEDVRIIPFHYHAAMPLLEKGDPQAFRDGSLAMENDPSGWRGLFLCSAFLVQATRPLDS